MKTFKFRACQRQLKPITLRIFARISLACSIFSRSLDRSLAMAQNNTYSCFYDLPLTRSRSRRACFGRITSFSGRKARERGFFDDVTLCVEHARVALDKSSKCCVLFDSSRCDGSLRTCSERLLPVLDDISGIPAAFICRRHHDSIDSLPEVSTHPLYRPPPKRQSGTIQVCGIPIHF